MKGPRHPVESNPWPTCFEATVLTTTPYLKLQCFVSHESVNSAILFSKRCIHLAAESIVWQLGSPVQESLSSKCSPHHVDAGRRGYRREMMEEEENQLRLNLLDQYTAVQLSAQTRLGLNMERFHASAATGKQTANEETWKFFPYTGLFKGFWLDLHCI